MPHPVDVAVGARVRELRIRAGLSQSALAEALGVSFQQIQKYEKGTNRMGASRLIQVAKGLGVPVMELFDGVTSERVAVKDVALDRDASKVARDWRNIGDQDTREVLRSVIHSFAGLSKAS